MVLVRLAVQYGCFRVLAIHALRDAGGFNRGQERPLRAMRDEILQTAEPVELPKY